MTHDTIERRHATRERCRSAVETEASTSVCPAGVRSTNVPRRGCCSPAPSDGSLNVTGASAVCNESSARPMAAPATACERTCSTATAPSRRESLVMG